MNALKKAWMPWTAADQFPSEEAFRQFLAKRLKRFDDLRVIALVLAAAFLIVGYVVDLRPIMLLTVLPLTATLLLTVAIGKTEALGK
jgi:hypothetical protein